MKKILLLIAFITTTYIAAAQSNDTIKSTREPTSSVVEIMPEFPGGQDKFMAYLKKNLKYPKQAKKNGIKGRVIITFVIERDGSVVDAKVSKSLSEETDVEAVRLINRMPKWTPGIQSGYPVRVQYTATVSFGMDDN